VRRLLGSLAVALPLAPVLRRLRRRHLLVLMYHGVVDPPLAAPCWHQLEAGAFAAQLAWLRRRYQVLPLVEALEAQAAGRLPPLACALTFDDGFANVASVAAPILEDLALPATVFLVPGAMEDGSLLWPDRVHLALVHAPGTALDLSDLGLGRPELRDPPARAAAADAVVERLKRLPRAEKEAAVQAIVGRAGAPPEEATRPFRLLDWGEVRALERRGLFEFASHGWSHEILSRCEDEEVERQVHAAYERLTARLGRAPRLFAYPNGRAEDFDQRARAALAACGVRWALATTSGLVRAGDDPLALPRIGVGAGTRLGRFRLLAAGLGQGRGRGRGDQPAAAPT
jgi:peptidoglycan/xylan/chitin deacetylase (PgdA/CDA1 family)